MLEGFALVDAVDGADLAFIAFDYVQIAGGEDGLDGGAAEGGGAGSAGVWEMC